MLNFGEIRVLLFINILEILKKTKKMLFSALCRGIMYNVVLFFIFPTERKLKL